MKLLDNLLVLCAAHGSPTRNCLDFLLAMREEGATIQLGQATSDAPLTRNNQAALAVETLATNSNLQWVLWIDWDMSSTVESVLLMTQVAIALKDEEKEFFPSVSGAYVNRHTEQRSELAGFAVRDASELEVTVEGRCVSLRCVPSLTGMGCLLQERVTFLAHCSESVHVCYPDHDHLIPVVCQAHPAHSSELSEWLDLGEHSERNYWIADDFDYCIRELEGGRLVYLVPVVFGHDKMVRTLPDSRTVLPGLVPRAAL